MSMPHHDQVRRRRLARLIVGTTGETVVSAITQRPSLTSTAANLLSAKAPPSSAFSSPSMGDDQSPVSTRKFEQTETSG